MPELRQREDATRAELQSIADQTTDRTAYLRLAETLTAFLARLRSSAETLDIIERQRVAIHERPSPDHSQSAVAGHASYSSRASGTITLTFAQGWAGVAADWDCVMTARRSGWEGNDVPDAVGQGLLTDSVVNRGYA